MQNFLYVIYTTLTTLKNWRRREEREREREREMFNFLCYVNADGIHTLKAERGRYYEEMRLVSY